MLVLSLKSYTIDVKKSLSLIFILLMIVSCIQETPLTFKEINQLHTNSATIEINIPKAEGEQPLSEKINKRLEQHLINSLNFGDDSTSVSLETAIANFDAEYSAFKNDFQDNAMIWEASFDGEVIYQTEHVICIALTSYSFTGGAHGNMNITFYNFNPRSGDVIPEDALINDKDSFLQLAKTHFANYLESEGKNRDDFFFGEDFHLPANIGFNDEGVILLYNTYEIASYADGMIEFVIPFEEVDSYLEYY